MSSGRGANDTSSGRSADDMSSRRGADDMSSGRSADDTSSGRSVDDMSSEGVQMTYYPRVMHIRYNKHKNSLLYYEQNLNL